MVKKKNTEYDPYELDVDEINRMEAENKPRSTGLPCPNRNHSLDGPCGVCEYLVAEIYSKGYEDGHPARRFAQDKKAKSGLFMNVVLPDNPKKAITLEMGSEVGNEIQANVKKKKSGWTSVANPKADKGRLLTITKTKRPGSKYPMYKVELDIETADWDVPKKVLADLPNLDQDEIIRKLEDGEFNDDNYMHVKSLGDEESLTFRMLPPWTSGEQGEDNRRAWEWLWRHWGVTQAHIDGEDKLNWREDDEEDPAPDKVKSDEPTIFDEEKKEKSEEKTEVIEKEPACYKKAAMFFDADDEDCQACSYFKPCGKKAAKDKD